MNHIPRVIDGLKRGYVDENQILVIYDHAVRARILTEHANENRWRDALVDPPENGEPVLGYHPDWVDGDFNRQGIRECFLGDDHWVTSYWVDSADSYITREDLVPQKWMSPHNPDSSVPEGR
ncbi:MAG: hypothetical protein AAFX93_00010 [Verrucomicrobiota bacterium]